MILDVYILLNLHSVMLLISSLDAFPFFSFQLLSGLCMLPFVYLLSFLFKSPLVAYATTVFVLSVVGLVIQHYCVTSLLLVTRHWSIIIIIFVDLCSLRHGAHKALVTNLNQVNLNSKYFNGYS